MDWTLEACVRVRRWTESGQAVQRQDQLNRQFATWNEDLEIIKRELPPLQAHVVVRHSQSVESNGAARASPWPVAGAARRATSHVLTTSQIQAAEARTCELLQPLAEAQRL